jgi:uncharacterized protein (DUF1800 family)
MGFELIKNSEGTIAGCVESENGTLTEQQANHAILCNKENPTESEIKESQDALDALSGFTLLRVERNKKLAETDWVVTMHKELGTNIPTAWKTYRQALRDITDDATSLDDVTWPEKP